jgi:hypothetical protein
VKLQSDNIVAARSTTTIIMPQQSSLYVPGIVCILDPDHHLSSVLNEFPGQDGGGLVQLEGQTKLVWVLLPFPPSLLTGAPLVRQHGQFNSDCNTTSLLKGNPMLG